MAFKKVNKLVQRLLKYFKSRKQQSGEPVRTKDTAEPDENASPDEYDDTDQHSDLSSAVDPYEHIFGSILHIEEHKLRNIARRHLADQVGDRCWVREALGGSYNRVFIIQFDVGTDHAVKYVIRIPYYGKPETWTEEDAFGFRSDVLTLRYIKKHTGLPVPDIIAYSATCDNELGHPYTLMSFMEGTCAQDLWFEDDDEEETRPETKEWRRKFLKSLANTMSKLQTLRFQAGGRLEFENEDDENPKVAPAYIDDDFDVHDPNHGANHNAHFIPVESCSLKEHFRELIEKWGKKWMENHKHVDIGQAEAEVHKGHFEILSTMIASLPFPDDEADGQEQDGKEEAGETEDGEDGGQKKDGVPHFASVSTATPSGQEVSGLLSVVSGETAPISVEQAPGTPSNFVLCHPDLDLQNIFVNDEGEVIGIIDWDHLKTKRCQQGWISMPWFLKRDWAQSFTEADEPPKGYAWHGDPLWTVEHIQKYRGMYAYEIRRVCGGTGDSIYAKKSHLYDALEEGLLFQERTGPVVDMMLRAILPQVDVTDYLRRMGSQGPMKGEEKLLKQRFRTLFQY